MESVIGRESAVYIYIYISVENVNKAKKKKKKVDALAEQRSKIN